MHVNHDDQQRLRDVPTAVQAWCLEELTPCDVSAAMILAGACIRPFENVQLKPEAGS